MTQTNRSGRCISLLSFHLILGFWLLVSPSILHAEERAREVIKKFDATLIEAMKDADQLGFEGRYKLLAPVIGDSFAIPFMAEQVTGKFWRTFTHDQRDLFLRTYTEWTVATYAGRFDGYSGEKFEIVSESQPVQGTVTVVSRFTPSRKEAIDFNYLCRKFENRWHVVDIKISGVSQLALTRAQFTGVLKQKGFDSLIALLREKIKNFSGKKP